MLANNKITIGTRGSKLALTQTQLVAATLKEKYPGLMIETKIITTKGDVNQTPIPLDTIGKAWFTEEIEQALLDREIDLAVHSLKDLPPEMPNGLLIMPILERADPRDVLITRSNGSAKFINLQALPKRSVVGTDSLRRKAQLLNMRPDLVVNSIRGNVDTRLRKLETENYDAIVIAAAGLERLGLIDRVTEFFDATKFIPAIGQGVLAAEIRKGEPEILGMLHSITHKPTSQGAAAEQAFSRVIGGGCKLPIGCYARIERDRDGKDKISLFAMVADEDGDHVVRRSAIGPLEAAIEVAEKLAREFNVKG